MSIPINHLCITNFREPTEDEYGLTSYQVIYEEF